MINQSFLSFINSRENCNPYDKTGFLPLIASNMYSVVNSKNASKFLQNCIKVCMPRKESILNSEKFQENENYFESYSLDEFIYNFIKTEKGFLNDSKGNIVKTCVCIDTANGNMNKLHEVIRTAKLTYADKLIIMSGNVSTVESFLNLAKTGCDYIRVGIGGGGACSTTSNVGVGQKDLGKLIKKCKTKINLVKDSYIYPTFTEDMIQEVENISKVKIVADGITSYINFCKKKYGYNSNGYAAINKLLYLGADLVMVGKLFAQCIESAGTKGYKPYNSEISTEIQFGKLSEEEAKSFYFTTNNLYTMYSGMSSTKEQTLYNSSIKPSEGNVQWIKVKWSLSEWLYGNQNQDEKPFLSGWINSVKSMMSYTNKTNLF